MTRTERLGNEPRGKRRIVRKRRGAMLVFVAVSMVALLGFLAMTLDVGAGNRQRRMAQTAADAAALAGASEIYLLQGTGVVTTAATTEASNNGFVTGGAVVVTPYHPPATGPHAGDTKYIEVVITKNHPNILGGVLGLGSLNIATRAVAGVGTYSFFCLYTLDPTGPNALNIQNGGEVDTNCGVAVSSNHANALNLNSSGDLDAGGSGIGVTGGWNGNANKVDPDPTTGAAAVPNPLSYVQMPNPVPACTVTGHINITTDITLGPGVYCGGISVNNKELTMLPGTYIMRGGGFSVSNGGVVTGAGGVTLINSIDPTNAFAFQPIDFGTGCKAKLIAPTSGDFKGILMFGDPAGPANIVNTFACASDNPPELTGSLYFPNQTIYFNGSNSGTRILGAVVAKSVDVKSKLTLTNDTSGNSGLQRFALVE